MVTWWQVDSGYACGGVATQEDVVTQACPIFHWMLGKRKSELGYKWVLCAVNKIQELAALGEQVAKCQQCQSIAIARKNTVFGEGNPDARIMFIGEAPGADEDAAGRPFIGKAGKLLTSVINRMGFYRKDVYIANILKCRPDVPIASMAGNRKPNQAEVSECLPYLRRQIEIIQPKVLVILGATALEAVLRYYDGVKKARTEAFEYQGIPVVVTYHPAYILRNPTTETRQEFWYDLLGAVKVLGYEAFTDEDRKWLPPVQQ